MGQDDLHQEWIEEEWIIVHLDSTAIADDLEHKATNHCGHESPCSIIDSLENLEAQNNGEDGDVEGVAKEGRDVMNLGNGDGTGGESAFVVRN